MPPFNILEKIRQMFTRRLAPTGKTKRTLRLVQLEDRRMLNATFVFNGVAQLDIAGFTNSTATLTIGETGSAPSDELTFTLDAGTWSGIDAAGISGNGLNVLTVEKSLFTDNADQLSANINALIAGANNVNVLLATDITLPDSATDGALNITSDGTVTLGFAVNGAGNDFSVDTTGAISQTAALSNIGDLNYDAGTTIGITAPITATGTVDIDSTGLTTIGALGDINAGGAVTFGAAKTGELTTSGDIDTTNDGVTFTRAVTLGGNIDIDTIGTTAGNIRFASTIATGGNDLSIDAGTAGDITLDGAATGGGDLVVRDGHVHNYSVLTVDSVSILDATTSVTFNGAVDVSANNVNGGTDAFKVNTPGEVTINGAITATSAAGLNIDIDPVNINVNANILATGQIDLTASNNILIAAVTVRADTNDDGGTLNITADDDSSGAGDLTAVDGSILRGHTVNLIGFDITTDVVRSDDGNLTIQAANEATLNDATTATTAQVLVTATANDVNLNGGITAGTNTTITAGGAIVDGNAGLNITAGTATLSAVNGIGSGNAIETNITALRAANTTAGTIEFTELAAGGDIALLAVNNGTRNVTITADNGSITDGNDSLLTANAAAAQNQITVNDGQAFAIGDTVVLSDGNSPSETFTVTAIAGNTLTLSANLASAFTLVEDARVAGLNISAGNAILTATAGSIGSLTPTIFTCSPPDPAFDPIEVALTGSLTAVAGNGVSDAVSIAGMIGTTATITATSALLQLNQNFNVAGSTFTVTNLGLVVTGVLTLPANFGVTGDLQLEGADIVATNLTANRIVFVSGQAETIIVTTRALDATAGGTLNVTNTLDTLDLVDLNCDNVALQTTNAAGNVIFNFAVGVNGTLTVTDDIIAGNDGATNSTGSINLTATNITVSDTILADNGNITILATNNIVLDTDVNPSDNADGIGALDNDDLNVITTIRGNITIIADSDNNPAGTGGSFTQQDGHRIIAGRDTVAYVPGSNGNPSSNIQSLPTALTAAGAGEAEVVISADGNVTLASVQSANSTADAIRITSVSGGIIDGGDTSIDIFANLDGALTTLRAATGIGTANEIELNVYAIDAVNLFVADPSSTSGHIRLQETTAGADLIVVNADNANTGSILIATNNGTLTVAATGFAPSNGVYDVTTGTGNILLAAGGAGSDVVVNNRVTSTNGAISILAQDSVFQNAGGNLLISTGSNAVANSIYVRAVDGSIVMADGVTSVTQGGNIRYEARTAGRDVIVGQLNAGTGNVSILAGRDILDARPDTVGAVGVNSPGFATQTGAARTVNIIASGAHLEAGRDVGGVGNPLDTQITRLAADAGSDVYLYESDALVIGNVGQFNVTRVNLDSTTTLVPTTALSGVNAATGHAKIETIDGTLTVDATVTAALNILLAAGGAGSDVVVNNRVTSTNGAISILAQDSVFQNAGGNLLISTGSNAVANSIYVRAVDGSIVMVDGVTSVTQGGNIRYEARTVDQDVTVGLLNAGTGNVSILAGRDILDARPDTVGAVGVNSPGFATQTGAARTVNIIASGAHLEAGRDVGAVGNPLDTQITTLAADAGSDVYLYESDALVIGNVGQFDVTRVNLDSSTTLVPTTALSAVAAATGNAKIETIDGTLTVDATVAAALNILLAAGGAGSDVVVNNRVTSTNGAISILAQDSAFQNAGGNLLISTGSNAVANSIYVRAVDGSIVMADGVTSVTQGGNIRYEARTVDQDVTVGLLNAGTGNVSILAGRDILDARPDTVGVDAEGFATQTGAARTVNIIASGARLEAGRSVGIAGNPLDTDIDTLAVTAGGNVYVYEQDALVIGDVGPVRVTRVNLNSTTTTVTDLALSGVNAATGHAKIETIDGTLTVDATVTAALNILLAARGAGSDVIVNAGVQSSTGHITLKAADDIDQNANVVTGGTGTVYLFAGNNTNDGITGIDMQSASITTAGGNVRLVADTESDIRLGLINAGGGNVSLVAEGSILDNNGAALNVQANALRMWADAVVNPDGTQDTTIAGNQVGIIGGPDNLNGDPFVNINAIDTQVTTLAAQSAGGIYVLETDGLTVEETGDISIQQVNLNSTTTTRTDDSLADLTTTANGSIKVVTLNGTLTVNDGAVGAIHGADGVGVLAHSVIDPNIEPSRGSILLEARGTGGDVVINAVVRTSNGAGGAGTGHITLNAADDIDQNANVVTGGTGTVYLFAGNNTNDGITGIDMQSGTSITTAGGNVRMVADNESDIRLGLINAGGGNVSLIAERSILDNNGNSSLSAVAAAAQNQVVLTSASGFAVGDIVLVRDGNSIAETLIVIAVSGNTLTLSGNLVSEFAPTDHATVSAMNVLSNALRMASDATVAFNPDGTDNFSLTGDGVGVIGGPDALNGPPADNINAIDTQVTTLAAQSANGIYVVETDGLTVDETGDITVQQVNFNSTTTARADLTLSDLTTTAAAAEIQIVILQGNLTINPGLISPVGVTASGNNSTIGLEAAGDVTINANITAGTPNAANSDSIAGTADERILIRSVTGVISIGPANSVTISTDDDLNPLTSSSNTSDTSNTSDSIQIIAGTIGTVAIGADVTLRTDGGVATHFYDRVGGTGTSLFRWDGTPFLSTVSRSGADYIVTFSLNVGVAGEENLRMDIDWRDPSDSRIESYYFTTPGLNVVSHTYSSNDFIEFITRNKPIFLADFSVSQHQSIQVLGGTLIQDGVTASKTSGPLSTTDLYAPDPSVHGPYGNPNLPGTNNPVTVVSDTDSNNDFHFEDGLVEIRVMTPPFPEIAPDPRPPAPAAAPADVPNLVVPFLVNVVPAEVVETPLSSFSTQSEDYFQLRKFDGETRIVVDEKYEHIDDDFGELLLLPSRLKQWVQVEELEDQTGLELWLITKKKTSEGDVIVERPVLKFDIAEGQPFPAKEPMPEIFEELKLVPMDIDGDANTQKPGTPGNSDGSPVPTDNPASGTNTEPNDGDDKTPAADGQSRFVPSHSGGGTLKSHPDYEETVSSTTSYSVLTSVAVGAVLNKSRTASMVPSKSRQMLNRILNRQR